MMIKLLKPILMENSAVCSRAEEEVHSFQRHLRLSLCQPGKNQGMYYFARRDKEREGGRNYFWQKHKKKQDQSFCLLKVTSIDDNEDLEFTHEAFKVYLGNESDLITIKCCTYHDFSHFPPAVEILSSGTILTSHFFSFVQIQNSDITVICFLPQLNLVKT